MKSMTGYGTSSEHDENLEVTVEINSVNRKSLDIFVSLPREWQAMEKTISDLVRGQMLRGKVNLYIQVKDLRELAGLSWEDDVIQATFSNLKSFADKNAIEFKPDADLLIRVITAIGNSKELPDWDAAWPLLEKTLKSAVEQLNKMREEEGAALDKDMVNRIQQMQTWRDKIEELSGKTVEQYRETLFSKLQKAKLELDLDDERVLKEIAIFADRCDIVEELTRLDSHFKQFLSTMQADGMVGRKLDFLCQEINREINTIGSKANSIEVTKLVIECKNELERIREQVQNIE